MGKKPSDEEIAYWCELRATGLSYQQIADKSFLKFNIRRSPETIRSHTKDVEILAEVEILDDVDFPEEDEPLDDVPASEEMKKKEIDITKKFIAGKSKTDVINEGEYRPSVVVKFWKFYDKEVLPDRMKKLQDALKEYGFWDPEKAAELDEDPYEAGVRDMHEKMEDAEKERDEAGMLLKVDVGLRKESEAKVEETMSNLEDTKKAFEAYKVEAKEKVNKAEKAQKKAEDDARSWTCPKCETLYVTVKNVSP